MFIILIWRGFGLLTLLTYFLVHTLLAFLIVMLDLNIYLGFASLEYMVLFVTVAGIVNWIIGTRLNAPQSGKDGESIRNKHGMFFIPMQYLSFVFAGLFMLLAYVVDERYPGDIKSFKSARARFKRDEANWKLQINSPELGDYYNIKLFPKDYKKGQTAGYRNAWPSEKNMKVIGFDETKIKLLEPDDYQGLSMRTQEILERIFANVTEQNGRVYTVSKKILLKTIPTNYYRSRNFLGVKVPELKSYERTVRLIGLHRF
ncbi:MAG: hypothetical protein GC192_02570 [Bacteroidetes bacterium]|nr:hypothetical protein [Bacteroidota bacterium]